MGAASSPPMDEDLKDDFYRFIYIATFVLVFCIIPIIYILATNDFSGGQSRYSCDAPLEIIEVLEEGEPGTPKRFSYILEDQSTYTSTVVYSVGDQVCRY